MADHKWLRPSEDERFGSTSPPPPYDSYGSDPGARTGYGRPPGGASIQPNAYGADWRGGNNYAHATAHPSAGLDSPTSTTSRPFKPIAIPATAAKRGSPFTRAYSPALAPHTISLSTFLAFLDKLNHVTANSPPLQVLGLAGNIIGFMPFASAQIVGMSINAAGALGNIAMSKGRTELFMHESNQQLFQPRGLKVQICQLDALAKIAGIPLLDTYGNIDKHTPLWQAVNSVEATGQDGHMETLRTLSPWIQDLEMHPSTPDPSPNAFKKFGAVVQQRQQKRTARKGMDEKEKVQEDYDKEMDKLDREEQEIRGKETGRKMQRELDKLQHERDKVSRKFEKDSGKARPGGSEEKVLWLVVTEIGDHVESEHQGARGEDYVARRY